MVLLNLRDSELQRDQKRQNDSSCCFGVDREILLHFVIYLVSYNFLPELNLTTISINHLPT